MNDSNTSGASAAETPVITPSIPSPRLHGRAMVALALGTLLAAAAALGVAPLPPDSTAVAQRQLIETLTNPLPAPLNTSAINTDNATASDSTLDLFVREETTRRGDTLPVLAARLGINDPAAVSYLQQSARSSQLALQPERLIQAGLDGNGNLRWLRYFQPVSQEPNATTEPVLSFTQIERIGPESFKLEAHQLQTERRVLVRNGAISSTLYAATDAADVPDGVTHQMIEALDGIVDLHHNLRRGDQFRVVYEGFFYQGKLLRPGRVLGLEFINRGTRHQLVWYSDTDSPDSGHYYTPNGQPLKTAFLQSPLEFTRISSGFSMRFHPLLHTWRAHKGIDYAAATGTPVRSTAAGKVVSIDQQSGYGKIIVLQHAGQYSTAYAHLSRYAPQLKKGSLVSQGEVIGYVGSTGWATGPHLHYEFRVEGTAVDPSRVAMPTVPALNGARLASFRQKTDTVAHQLYVLSQARLAAVE